MNCFTRISNRWTSYFNPTHNQATSDRTFHKGQNVDLVIPACPLNVVKSLSTSSLGQIKSTPVVTSVKIVSNIADKNLYRWQSHTIEAQKLMHAIIQVWEKMGISDHLIYQEQSNPSEFAFSQEIVPYSKNRSPIRRQCIQLKVLKNIIVVCSRMLQWQQEIAFRHLQNERSLFLKCSTQPSQKTVVAIEGIAPSCIFCSSKVLSTQLVFQGKEVNVLYNYKPINLGHKLHFMIIPQKHRPGFSQVTETELLECTQLTQSLVRVCDGTAYIYSKTGIEAGQTVAHWHQHVVLTNSKALEWRSPKWYQRLLCPKSKTLERLNLKCARVATLLTKWNVWRGKVTVFVRLARPSSPLSSRELQQRVDFYKSVLPLHLDATFGQSN